jgi:hypothetical protein
MGKNIRDYLKDVVRQPSVLTLIFSNLFTIILAVCEHWSLGELMYIYWWQNIIIGLFNVPRILMLDNSAIITIFPELSSPNIPPLATSRTKIALAIFFVVHYGIFHSGYLCFIHFLFKGSDPRLIFLPTAVFFLHHLFSFLKNYKEDEKKLDVRRVMFLPYQRIIPMHLTIMAGTFIMMVLKNRLAEQFVLILFLILKTYTDVKMHRIEHRLQGVLSHWRHKTCGEKDIKGK